MVQNCHAVRHRQRLALVVRHVDDRRPELAVQRLDLDLHLLAQLLVEGRQRLIHQDDPRLEDHGTGECNPRRK
jgi:hypothetical protein